MLLLRLREADGLGLSVLAYEEIDLNPFVGAFFVDGQAEVAESAAPLKRGRNAAAPPKSA